MNATSPNPNRSESLKIAFLTSSLDPGRDGVGDYTALLAAECERLGHKVRLLALNDPFADGEMRNPDLLRLGVDQPWTERVKSARDFLDDFSPDFVSLQFVCYGFHPRGIDFQLAARLKKIIGDRPAQIMFHELWIGADGSASLKQRLTGLLQRRCILDLFRRLDVRAVHTSNPAYVALLQAEGVRAGRLPLFGSIPVSDARREVRDGWTFGMFGPLHPVWPPEPLFARLRETGVKITVTHIGRMGSGEALWEKITREYAGVFEFRKLGEQPPEKIAEFFSTLDFGIATSPWELVGKSATVAAMLEHGLPVVVNRDDVHYPGWRETGYSPLLIKMDGDFLSNLASIKRGTPHLGLPDVAKQFLAALPPSAQN